MTMTGEFGGIGERPFSQVSYGIQFRAVKIDGKRLQEPQARVALNRAMRVADPIFDRNSVNK
jgi:hypothetical protein